MISTKAQSGTQKTPVLFVSYEERQCGVYQYGKNLLGALQKSDKYRFDYAGIRNLEDIDSHANNSDYAAIIYNYHPLTLTFIKPELPRRYKQVNIAVMHEMTQAEADRMPDKFFQHYVMSDPTLIENNPAVFKTGRLILPYTNGKEPPDVTTIGTFGFSLSSKGYQRLVDMVQNEFDDAIIRIHVPSNGIIDADGSSARQQIQECQRRIRKPGIRIQASHEFLSHQAMLDLLAGNTINAFLYDYLDVSSLSSSPDYALAVRRPIVISKCVMFRHLQSLDPPITIEDSSLKELVKNGIEPFSHLYQLWNEKNVLREYENILDKTLDPSTSSEFQARLSKNDTEIHVISDFDYKKLNRRYNSRRNFVKRRIHQALTKRAIRAARATPPADAPRAKGVKRFNRILDNQARVQYAPVIRQLYSLAPEIMVSKIPAANVQQAFVFDTVRKFAASFPSPKILCVGSYDDSAAASLKKLGYSIEEIDPEVNGLDLNTFFHLPSTIKSSYDIILSTSVLEHVPDDELFMGQIAELLAPSGVGILTCDYNNLHTPQDPVIPGDYRFYTQKDLISRILPSIKGCSLVDVPQWECLNPDFMFYGYRYTFATLVFQKDR
ncbi:MAG: methyltransferase domain-containing protein [Pyrinomonadaceae bacterium]